MKITTATTTITTTALREVGRFGGESDIEVKNDSNVDGKMTKTNRNTGKRPNMPNVYTSRLITNILANMVDLDLVDLGDTRGALMVAVYLDPPSFTDTSKDWLQNDVANIFGVVNSLKVLLE